MKRKNRQMLAFFCLTALLLLLCGCAKPSAGGEKQVSQKELPAFHLSTGITEEVAPETLQIEDIKKELQKETEDSAAQEQPQEEPADTAHPEEAVDVLNQTVAQILAADESFLCGYPLDDSFLFWFRSQYGQKALEELAARAGEDADVQSWYEQSGRSLHVLWLDYCEQLGLHEEQLSRVTRKDSASSQQTVISIAGDMNFADRTGTMRRLKEDGISGVFSKDIRALAAESDIMMVNNECVFSTRGTAAEQKETAYHAWPTNAFVLAELGVDIVSLANDHVTDYGAAALADTLQTLHDTEIVTVGAGASEEEAESPWYFIVNGRKIAFLAASQIASEVAADSEKIDADASEDAAAAVFEVREAERLQNAIRTARTQSDYVLVFLHWGTVGSKQFRAAQTAFAEQLADAGADAVFGSHPHCLQGISYVESAAHAVDVPVFYSLGDFWFSDAASDGMKKKDTAAVQLVIDADGTMRFRVVPCVQENGHTYMETEPVEKARLLTYVQYLSDGVSIDADGYVTKK